MSDGQESSSGLSPNEFSNSGSHSVSGQHSLEDLPRPEPVLGEFFDGALVFDILKPAMLLGVYPPLKVLEALKEEPERVADIVQASTGMHRAIVLRRFDLERYAEDIQAGIETEPDVAKSFLDAIGVDFFLEHMPPKDLYQLVMGTGWMLEDSPQHRAFAASLCRSLVKHKAFGDTIRTLENIKSAISIDTLMSDAMPHALRTRLMEAALRGAKKYKTRRLAEYMFDKDDGVPFEEMAEHLPVEPLARPFAAFADLHKLAETNVERPSELPPSDHPAVARPPLPAIPKPPPYFGMEPRANAESGKEPDGSEGDW